MVHRYSVYGVSVSSDVPFELPIREDTWRTDPHVRFARGGDEEFGGVPVAGSPDEPWFVCAERGDESIYLRWSGLYEFLVAPCGTHVAYRPLQHGDAAVLQNFLLGQALSFALVRQGVEPIHAAVIDLDGRGIGLLGDCGFGKSTLAGSLMQAGHRLVTDDVLIVDERGAELMVRAGTGRIKLLPDSAASVMGVGHAGIPVAPQADKLVFRLDDRLVQNRDVPLEAFLILPAPTERAACDRVEIQRTSRAELFYELVRNTFVCDIENGRRLQRNFSVNARIASSVDGYKLRYPPGIDRLPMVRQAVLEHFHQDREIQ